MICQLKIKLNENESEHKKINLTTFESRENLKHELNDVNENLKIELEKIKTYIQTRFSLNDLLN